MAKRIVRIPQQGRASSTFAVLTASPAVPDFCNLLPLERGTVEGDLTIYEGVNEQVCSLVPSSAGRILDVGCGTGTLGERLRRERERCVTGITYSDREAEMATGRLSRVICAELNDYDFAGLGKFDCVILSHILEHLYHPEEVLRRLRSVLDPESVVIVALPNVLWWRQRLEFLAGRWRYRDWGLLDRTHYRFFDLRSSQQLLEQAGYEVLRSVRGGVFLNIERIRKVIGPIAPAVDAVLTKLAPGLFSFQFVYLARIKR
jgi:SAM-dependent methyltransferase